MRTASWHGAVCSNSSRTTWADCPGVRKETLLIHQQDGCAPAMCMIATTLQ